MQPGFGLESGLDGQQDSRLLERRNAAVALAHLKTLVRERVQLGQPKLAVKLLVEHVGLSD